MEVSRRTRNYTSRHAVRYAAACRFAAEAPSYGASAIWKAHADSSVVDLGLDALSPHWARPIRPRNRMFARKGRRQQAHKQQQQRHRRHTHGREPVWRAFWSVAPPPRSQPHCSTREKPHPFPMHDDGGVQLKSSCTPPSPTSIELPRMNIWWSPYSKPRRSRCLTVG